MLSLLVDGSDGFGTLRFSVISGGWYELESSLQSGSSWDGLPGFRLHGGGWIVDILDDVLRCFPMKDGRKGLVLIGFEALVVKALEGISVPSTLFDVTGCFGLWGIALVKILVTGLKVLSSEPCMVAFDSCGFGDGLVAIFENV